MSEPISTAETDAAEPIGPLRHSLVQALIFPFRCANWAGRLVWVSLFCFIPIIDLLLLSGWRLELVRRLGRGEEQPLPAMDGAAGFWRMLRQGFALWCMHLLYALVPLVIIFGTGDGVLSSISDVSSWAWAYVTGGEAPPASEVFDEEVRRLFYRLGIQLACLVCLSPIFRAGMIRYAMGGSVLAFLNLPANLALVLRNPGYFLWLFVGGILLGLFTTVFSFALGLTGVGGLLLPAISLPLYHWATGYEYAVLARRLHLDSQSASA